MSKPKINQVNISDLRPHQQNPRKRTPLSAGVIQRSLEQFGACRSIVIDENGVVMAGNGTLEEAGQLGIEKVIVVETTGNELVAVKRTNLTKEQWDKYLIADNTASDFSTWDADVLAEIAEQVDLDGFFPTDKLDEVLAELAKQSPGFADKEEDEDDLQDVLDNTGKVESRVKLGDIWALGRHRICCADSTVERNVRALLGDRFNEVGMVWADAPYGMKFDPMKDRTKPFGSASALSEKPIQSIPRPPVIGDDSIDTAIAAFNICRKMTNQFWWGANYYSNYLPPSSCWIVWDKENSGDFADCELAWTDQKSAVRIFRHMWNGCLKASEHGEKRVHPTQKPVKLFTWCAEKYGKPDDIIFDPFLGSGISIIGCEELDDNRTVFGFELSEIYCETILQRFSNFTGIIPELVGRLPE